MSGDELLVSADEATLQPTGTKLDRSESISNNRNAVGSHLDGRRTENPRLTGTGDP
ncbi:hypothetical protein [Natrinema sp. CBA1119]|uniref:hypothetical protein n=1 Tax=Natrinema sp. CBA1119 TaxID=1608465 RepID=UPI00159BA5BD|nr:hypothetical protein [Natrinema sp. CBA1119]